MPRSSYPPECPVFRTAGGVIVTGDGPPWRRHIKAPWHITCRKFTGGAHGNVNLRNLRPLTPAARDMLALVTP